MTVLGLGACVAKTSFDLLGQIASPRVRTFHSIEDMLRDIKVVICGSIKEIDP